MNPIIYWARRLTHLIRVLPLGLSHWLGDTFGWYRKSKGGVWCYWNGFWAPAEPKTNLVRYQRGVAGYNPEENKWLWDCDKTLKVGDALINRTETYDIPAGAQS